MVVLYSNLFIECLKIDQTWQIPWFYSVSAASYSDLMHSKIQIETEMKLVW